MDVVVQRLTNTVDNQPLTEPRLDTGATLFFGVDLYTTKKIINTLSNSCRRCLLCYVKRQLPDRGIGRLPPARPAILSRSVGPP